MGTIFRVACLSLSVPRGAGNMSPRQLTTLSCSTLTQGIHIPATRKPKAEPKPPTLGRLSLLYPRSIPAFSEGPPPHMAAIDRTIVRSSYAITAVQLKARTPHEVRKWCSAELT